MKDFCKDGHDFMFDVVDTNNFEMKMMCGCSRCGKLMYKIVPAETCVEIEDWKDKEIKV